MPNFLIVPKPKLENLAISARTQKIKNVFDIFGIKCVLWLQYLLHFNLYKGSKSDISYRAFGAKQMAQEKRATAAGTKQYEDPWVAIPTTELRSTLEQQPDKVMNFAKL